ATRITPPQASASVAEIINPITLSAQLEAGLPLQTITSGYHPVRVAQSGQRYQISFEAGAVSMDRDLELRWAATPSDTPRAALFQERVGEEYFAMALLVPPHTSDAKSPPIARNVIFVIDTSGSMQGQSIEQARSSLQMALQRLHPRDTFNIIEFNERYSSLFQDPRHATPLHLEQANRFVYSLQADGGTEMAPALGEALRQSVPHDRLSQVVFITDGAVGNETYLFELIHNRVGSARLFTVGIGAAPNSYFMRQAAKFGRGSYTHIGSVNEVGSRMITLFQKLESPVVHGFNVNWVGAKEVWPQKLPDLYRNEPLILTARLDSPSSTLSLAGLTGASSWSQQIESDASSNHRGVATLWAQDKIDALLDSKIAGADPDQVRKKVLKIALAHQLMSPYTSLVAVQQQARRANGTPFDSVNVGNATPHGQRSLPYPQGATAAPLQALIGTLSLLGWLALRRRRWEAAVC
ncbi:MAG: VWA domain-containing protein, partial [Pseudomonadota bacterium]